MSQQKINEITNQIFGKNKEFDHYDTWVYLMLNFGWIPYDEFLNLDSEVLDKLFEKLEEMNIKRSKK